MKVCTTEHAAQILAAIAGSEQRYDPQIMARRAWELAEAFQKESELRRIKQLKNPPPFDVGDRVRLLKRIEPASGPVIEPGTEGEIESIYGGDVLILLKSGVRMAYSTERTREYFERLPIIPPLFWLVWNRGAENGDCKYSDTRRLYQSPKQAHTYALSLGYAGADPPTKPNFDSFYASGKIDIHIICLRLEGQDQAQRTVECKVCGADPHHCGGCPPILNPSLPFRLKKDHRATGFPLIPVGTEITVVRFSGKKFAIAKHDGRRFMVPVEDLEAVPFEPPPRLEHLDGDVRQRIEREALETQEAAPDDAKELAAWLWKRSESGQELTQADVKHICHALGEYAETRDRVEQAIEIIGGRGSSLIDGLQQLMAEIKNLRDPGLRADIIKRC